jgi:uncharacterized membrane protein
VHDPLFIAAVVIGCVVISELLASHTVLRHAGTALLVIIVTAIVSNIGIIPSTSTPIYDGVFSYLAPLAIFWLLLRVNLRDAWAAGLPLLGLFLTGAAGTVGGVLLGVKLVGPAAFGDLAQPVAGMFAATYTGGSANFNAIALHYGVIDHAPLYAGALAVDAGLTALWMAATIVLPRMLSGGVREPAVTPAAIPNGGGPEHERDIARVGPLDLALVIGLGLGSLWLANALAPRLAELGFALPSIVVLTLIALVLAQLGPVARLRGANTLGMVAVYVFLAVIGALCDAGALQSLGEIGVALSVLAATCIGVHGLVTFGAAKLFRLDPALAAIASQANIGGGTTALALARSLGRADLVLPAILVGSVGTALGTFIGFVVAEL